MDLCFTNHLKMPEMNFLKNNSKYFYLLISIFCYGFIAFEIQRKDFILLLISYSILFICYYKIVFQHKEDFKFLLISTILLRIVFGWVLPNLSQDFYRFIWDGRLIVQGLNPYLDLPKNLVLNPNFHLRQAEELFAGMGKLSTEHFSNYPPINQLCFAIAGFFSPNSISGSVIVLRILIIIADLGTLYFGRKLLNNLGLDQSKIFWFLLNPLVILELSGNLHFEGVMLFLFVLSMYLLQQKYWQWAAFILSISISVKLLPILILPIFIKYLGFKKSIAFYSIIIMTNVAFFLPFLSNELIENYFETIGLWFTNFEFNASVYYLIRWIGFQVYGYNIIHLVGKIIPVLIILFITYRAFISKHETEINLFKSFLIVLSIYFFMSTTVHPWYLANLVLLSVFTKYKFPIVWSFFMILSYNAYSKIPFDENLGMVFIEYFGVLVFLTFEIYKIEFCDIKNN
jgi:alpha-1,6-mannosyltransferase